MRAEAFERFVDGAKAVIVNKGRGGVIDKRLLAFQNAEIAGFLQITVDDEWQPQKIVGNFILQAKLRNRMPPMINRAVFELMPCVQKNLFLRALSIDGQKDLAVLQLIAKAKRAAGLIVRRASPQASGDGLIFQPSVEHEIHR